MRRPVCGPVAAALAVLLLGGCMDLTAEDADEVDRDRLSTVLSDPWLAPEAGRIARSVPGTNRGYRVGTAWAAREVDRPRDEVGRLELDAAERAGWWVTYGRCPLTGPPPDLGPDKPDEPRPPAPEATAVVLHVARDLPDGSFAQAVLQLEDRSEPSAEAPRTWVGIAAYVAHHQQPAAPRPREVDVSGLVCLAPVGTAGTVPGPVGEAELVNRAGRQPREDR